MTRKGPAEREIIRDDIDEMLREGTTEPFQSGWAFKFVLETNMDDKLRFCVDYKRFNLKNVGNIYHLSCMENCVDNPGDAAVFLTIDCNSFCASCLELCQSQNHTHRDVFQDF